MSQIVLLRGLNLSRKITKDYIFVWLAFNVKDLNIKRGNYDKRSIASLGTEQTTFDVVDIH